MATIINTPGGTGADNSGMGMVLAVIVILVAAFLFIVYGLPAIRRSGPTTQQPTPTNINVQVPTPKVETNPLSTSTQ